MQEVGGVVEQERVQMHMQSTEIHKAQSTAIRTISNNNNNDNGNGDNSNNNSNNIIL